MLVVKYQLVQKYEPSRDKNVTLDVQQIEIISNKVGKMPDED